MTHPLPSDCEAVLAQLDAFRRDELSTEETLELRRHLDACEKCLHKDNYERSFLQRLRGAGLASGCPEELRARVNQRLTQAMRAG